MAYSSMDAGELSIALCLYYRCCVVVVVWWWFGVKFANLSGPVASNIST